MKKHLIPLLISLFLCIAFFACAEGTVEDASGTYQLGEDGSLTLVKGADTPYVTIPGSINGCRVTAIGGYAFCGAADLKQVAIPSPVTRIETNAFSYCTHLETIYLPDSLTDIGESAFAHCSSLTELELPCSLVSLGKEAFNHCTSLTELVLPDTLTQIGVNAFTQCSGLTELTIPGSVEALPFGAFSCCTGLKTVQIEPGVAELNGAFFYCTSLDTVTIPDTVTAIADNEFSRCNTGMRIVCGADSAARSFAVKKQLLLAEDASDTESQVLTPQQLVNRYAGDLDNGRLTSTDRDPAFAGKLLIAVRRDADSIELVEKGSGYGSVPDEWLTDDPAEADTLVFITRDRKLVGTYSSGGSAYKTYTLVRSIDLHSEKASLEKTVAVNDPPSTITVTVINGVATGGSASGRFEEDTAADYIVQNYSDSVPSAAEPEEALPASEESGIDPALFSLLEDDLYRTTYASLASGETVSKGTKGSTARGIQQTLIAFGLELTADGSFGSKSLQAVNELRAAFGADSIDTVTAESYAELLRWLVFVNDPDASLTNVTEAEHTYLRACVLVLQGKTDQARELFATTDWKDAASRAEAAPESRPARGEIYRNKGYSGKKTRLTFKVNAEGDSVCTLFKLYAENGDLVSCVFIDGSHKATVKLPKGTYMVKMGIGTEWYGLEDAFGASGSYQIMTFENGSETVTLKSGYEYTLTINTSDNSGQGVGSEYESWSDF